MDMYIIRLARASKASTVQEVVYRTRRTSCNSIVDSSLASKYSRSATIVRVATVKQKTRIISAWGVDLLVDQDSSKKPLEGGHPHLTNGR
jgi:hypothetical protein